MEGDADIKGTAFDQAAPPPDDTVIIGGPAPAAPYAPGFHDDKPAGNVDFPRLSATADADAGPTVEKNARPIGEVDAVTARTSPDDGSTTGQLLRLASSEGYSPSPQPQHAGDDVPVYVPTTMSAMEARTWVRDGNRLKTSREKNDYFSIS